jgi:hypothetical protein
MRYCITGTGKGATLQWKLWADESEGETSVSIQHFRCTSVNLGLPFMPETREQGLKALREALVGSTTTWITPGFKDWIVNLNSLKGAFPELDCLDWLKGNVPLEPQFEWGETRTSQGTRAFQEQEQRRRAVPDNAPHHSALYESTVSFILVREAVQRSVLVFESPPEIQPSLLHFAVDYPHPEKVGFIIMRFGGTEAQDRLLGAIKAALRAHGLDGVRADEKQYHDDLFQNVLTFMHGCGFAVAVFEHAEESGFNPNIALEVGYLLAMHKPVCLLKDHRLETLHSDLMGKLYLTFDARAPVRSIRNELTSWLLKKGLV